MDRNVFITAAVTGSASTQHKSPHLPITPKAIAEDAIAFAKAGAAIAHIHVRDPKTGEATRDIKLYQEVVDRIRDKDTDVVINLTTGMGGDLYLGPAQDPTALGANTDLVGQVERQEHVELLLPEICFTGLWFFQL